MKFLQFPSQKPLTASTLSGHSLSSAAKENSRIIACNRTNKGTLFFYAVLKPHTLTDTWTIEELCSHIDDTWIATTRIARWIICYTIGTANRRKFISITCTILATQLIAENWYISVEQTTETWISGGSAHSQQEYLFNWYLRWVRAIGCTDDIQSVIVQRASDKH